MTGIRTPSRGISVNAPVRTNRQPGTPGWGPVTEAGAAVEGSGGAEHKVVT